MKFLSRTADGAYCSCRGISGFFGRRTGERPYSLSPVFLNPISVVVWFCREGPIPSFMPFDHLLKFLDTHLCGRVSGSAISANVFDDL